MLGARPLWGGAAAGIDRPVPTWTSSLRIPAAFSLLESFHALVTHAMHNPYP